MAACVWKYWSSRVQKQTYFHLIYLIFLSYFEFLELESQKQPCSIELD